MVALAIILAVIAIVFGIVVTALSFIYIFAPAALILGFLGLLLFELIKRDLTERRGRASL